MITETDSLKKRIADCIERKKLADAKNLLMQQLNEHPMDIEAKMLLGRVLIEAGEVRAAFEVFREIESAFIDLSMFFVHLGDIYRNRGMNREATDCYHKFLDLNPGSAISKELSVTIDSLIGNHESYSGDKDSSKEMAGIAPEFYTITLADLYVRQGHIDMACEVLEKMLIKNPANEDAAKLLRELKPVTCSESDSGVLKNKKMEIVINKLTQWLNKCIDRKADQPMVH